MPSPHDAVERVFARYRDTELEPVTLARLEADAITAFRTALTALGVDPDHYDLVVHIDELVGPMAFVVGPGDENRPLPAFDHELRAVLD